MTPSEIRKEIGSLQLRIDEALRLHETRVAIILMARLEALRELLETMRG